MEIVLPTIPPVKLYLTKKNTHESWDVQVDSYEYSETHIRRLADEQIQAANGISQTGMDGGTF